MSYGYGELIDDQPRTSRRDRRSRRKKKRGFGSFLAVVLSLSIIGFVGWQGYNWANETLRDWFAGPADYEGPGTGSVEITIPDGASIREIGNLLRDNGVVASSDAFVSAAEKNPDSRSVQAGTYSLMLEMPAADALNALLDNASRVVARIVIPEGLRLDQIVNRIADNEDTDFTKKQVRTVLDAPGELGLPDYAEGSVEGFLFPATYDIEPETTAESLVKSMVSRFHAAAESVELESRAADGNITPLQAVTIASIIQREVRNDDDMPNVAQVIYNRLNGSCAPNGVPEGYLQMDSTVHYAAGDADSVFTSDEQRQIDSPYNTYVNPGIPPGPIASPGEKALAAALNPSEGDFCYFVAVNLETGETKFAATEEEHLANRQELEAYCADSDAC
ncbi:MAG TPA: endolytic transglycosylase MltG [Jiangellaceae bacterium]